MKKEFKNLSFEFEEFQCDNCNKNFYSINRMSKCSHCQYINNDDVIGNGENKETLFKIELCRLTGNIKITKIRKE